MIQFGQPLVLIAAAPILAAAIYLALRKRRYPVLRTVILTVAIVATAAPFVLQLTSIHNIFFLVDRSASVVDTANDDEIRTDIQDIVDAVPDARYGLIEFAKTPVVSSPLGRPNLQLGMTTLDESGTDLGAAVDLGLSIMPPDQSNQLVLLSDGRFDDLVQDSLSVAELSGVSISVVPVGAGVPRDVSLSAFTGPTTVQIGRSFEMQVQITAHDDQPVRLIVYRDDDIVTVQDLQVSAGTTMISVNDRMDAAGSSVYQAIVKGEGDPISANDDLSLLVSSTERPSVLVIDRLGTSEVSQLLDSLGIAYNTAQAVPSLEVLSDYRQLILASGNLENYTLTEVETIDQFARELGGGVLLISSQDDLRGFSRGGIEELLPVTYSVPEKMKEASLAVVYLLDRSASMRARVDGVEKLDVLKEAAIASINLLDADSLVGIIAFDRVYDWVLPIEPIDLEAIAGALQPMSAVGGTDIYFPLVDALDHLDQVEARSKNILLISDGKAGDEVRDYRGLANRLAATTDTTLSAIAVGTDPNTTLLGALVEAGGGRMYLADDFASLPQVSIEATQRMTRERFVNDEIAVQGRLAQAMAPEEVPPVQGYVVSYPKETAQTLLWGGEDPLVSSWRIGLGSVTVLNTDLSGVWSAKWFEWGRLPELFGSILATTEPEAMATLGLAVQVTVDGSTSSILVDARNDDGTFADFLDIDAQVLPLDVTVPLIQVSPGLYYARIPTPAKGGYAVHVIDHTRDRSTSVPFSVPYSHEYAALGQDTATLSWIADASDGVVLGAGASLPEAADTSTTRERPLYALFIAIALGLFLLELVVRKWPVRRRASPGSS